jgi:hypothetical protein
MMFFQLIPFSKVFSFPTALLLRRIAFEKFIMDKRPRIAAKKKGKNPEPGDLKEPIDI